LRARTWGLSSRARSAKQSRSLNEGLNALGPNAEPFNNSSMRTNEAILIKNGYLSKRWQQSQKKTLKRINTYQCQSNSPDIKNKTCVEKCFGWVKWRVILCKKSTK